MIELPEHITHSFKSFKPGEKLRVEVLSWNGTSVEHLIETERREALRCHFQSKIPRNYFDEDKVKYYWETHGGISTGKLVYVGEYTSPLEPIILESKEGN